MRLHRILLSFTQGRITRRIQWEKTRTTPTISVERREEQLDRTKKETQLDRTQDRRRSTSFPGRLGNDDIRTALESLHNHQNRSVVLNTEDSHEDDEGEHAVRQFVCGSFRCSCVVLSASPFS